MEKNVFAKRLCEAMNNKKVKQVDIINEAESKGIKIGKSHISQYVNGKTIPRDNILSFLAEYLNVELEWLRGNSMLDSEKDIDNETENKIEKNVIKGDIIMREFKK